jgi:hypothetical protein
MNTLSTTWTNWDQMAQHKRIFQLTDVQILNGQVSIYILAHGL